jgi:hypothetical protein
MSKAWLLVLAGVIVLATVPAILTGAEGTAPPEGRREGGNRPPPVQLTEEQQTAMKPALEKLDKAMAEFKAQVAEIAKKVNLSEQDTQRFALRAASQAIRKAYGIEGMPGRRTAQEQPKPEATEKKPEAPEK